MFYAVTAALLFLTGVTTAYVATERAKRAHELSLRSKPFPKEWETYLEKNVKLYGVLPSDLQRELKGYINLFVAEKHFEGAGELEVTDEMRVTVAAMACLLLLNRKTRNYPDLRTVILYPAAYLADPDGEVVRLGESWNEGEVVLSWSDVTGSARDARDGKNLVLHEFAHRLDQRDGSGDGVPDLPTEAHYFTWAEVMSGEFERLRKRVHKGYKTFIRPYGATNAAEFFACITEAFFEQPHQLMRKHPDIYRELKGFYNLDPASWRKEKKTYLGGPFRAG